MMTSSYLEVGSRVSFRNILWDFTKYTWDNKWPFPPVAWWSVCCERCVLWGRGLCVGLVISPEGSTECDREVP